LSLPTWWTGQWHWQLNLLADMSETSEFSFDKTAFLDQLQQFPWRKILQKEYGISPYIPRGKMTFPYRAQPVQ
jgi:hypothetical protein